MGRVTPPSPIDQPEPTVSLTPATPPADESPLSALERELRVLTRRAGSSANAMAKRIHPDLDASAYPLLAHIWANPGVRGSDLAQQFGVGRATISRQLARLESVGLVDREVDPEDSRGQVITLTEAGATLLRTTHERRVDSISQALSDWSSEDVAALAGLLHRYSEDVVRWQATH
ncbi:MarR family transcriptional regulator [Oerskovia sp. Sa1BUA8]|uniref:MarR family transcriptional regulator n=1 Tax=Oerskovia douganii TaxID=2762210 RepID=A0A9D5UJH9_9CELL|nr:MarR family transcriptional regulator [Oerskovia douganii]